MLDYGLVGNCKTSALIKKNSSVEWMCFPTFSSPSIFAKLIDEKKGGFLQIKPKGKYKITQKYIPHTAILETTFKNKNHAFKVIDFFPRYRKLLKNKCERLVRQNRLIRIIKPIKGTPKIKIFYDPKPNYAKSKQRFKVEKDNLMCQKVSLISNIPYDDIIRKKEIELHQTKYLIVGAKEKAKDFSVKRCQTLLTATKKYWERFVGTLSYPKQDEEMIIRSAITLKLLTYSQTGAIIAAPTTSIPEIIGKPWTWDYRFCWVRDAVFAANALEMVGRNHEAKKLMRFFIDLVLKNKSIQIMYGINGETNLREKKLNHLAGFKNTKPVRIGNAAYKQPQHDIYGEILDLIYLYFVYYQFEHKITLKYWRFIVYIIKQITSNWKKHDSGIWEFRGRRRHYTYSKLMCYLGVDRAIKIAQHFKKEKYLEQWVSLREEIRSDILEKGYHQKKHAFTMYYGSERLDASLLLMAFYHFLEKDDPRLINTVNAIYDDLRTGCYVRRYKLKNQERGSAFTICSFWLVEALYYIGEEEKAKKMYHSLLKKANHLGLFSEDLDIKTGKLLGNFPQAYTHIALINSAILLNEGGKEKKKNKPRKSTRFSLKMKRRQSRMNQLS